MGEPKDITEIKLSEIRYSICTFVTRHSQYNDMVESFVSHGFSYDDCEYLYIDNSETNHYEAYAGINKFLAISKGLYIIICHQDVLLLQDDRKKLDAVIEELDQLDPNWGVCGNGGGIHPGRLALRVTDPHGDDQFTERLPIKVRGLDENFLVARRDANLTVSRDLHGFHLYGCRSVHRSAFSRLHDLCRRLSPPSSEPRRQRPDFRPRSLGADYKIRSFPSAPNGHDPLDHRFSGKPSFPEFRSQQLRRAWNCQAARPPCRETATAGRFVTRPYHAKFPLAAGVPLGHRLLDGALSWVRFRPRTRERINAISPG
jgi:hypothetical protein